MVDFVGTSGNDTLTGTPGDDLLQGLDGDDILIGLGGNNILQGGIGNDLLIINTPSGPSGVYDGGDGVDTLRVNSAAGMVMEGNDPSVRSLFLQASTLTSIEKLQFVSAAGQEFRVFISTGQIGAGLSATAQLEGGEGQDVLFVLASAPGTYTLPGFTKLNWTDFTAEGELGDLVVLAGAPGGNNVLNASAGHSGVEILIGGSGNDTLNGSDGVEKLIGGGGRDSISAGGGNDRIEISDPATNGSVFDGGDGIDTIEIGSGAGVAVPSADGNAVQVVLAGVSFNSIEGLELDSEEGGSLRVIISTAQIGGSISATAELNGGDGNDSLLILTGPAGTYTLSSFVRGESWNSSADVLDPGDTVGLVVGNQSGDFTLNASANHAGVEALVGGAGNDTLNGTDGIEILNGNGGVNILNAGGGDDKLVAANILPFGAPPTSFTFAGSQFNGGAGFDWLSLGGYVNFQGSLSSIEGIELQRGFAPAGPGTQGQADAGVDISTAVLGDLPAALALRGAGDLDISVEAGDGFDGSAWVIDPDSEVDIEIFGSDQGDLIIGTTSDDEISGDGGNDTLDGGSGRDELFGEAGDDMLLLSHAPIAGEIYDGGEGTDTLLVQPGAGATVSGPLGQGSQTILAGTTIGSIERLAFGSVDGGNQGVLVGLGQLSPGTTLVGGGGNDNLVVLATGGGAFTLPGYGRENWTNAASLFAPGDAVTLLGVGSASYTLNASSGHAGVEGLLGGGGNDTLNGSDGMEVLNGGGGINILNAGGGNDRLVAANNHPLNGPTTNFTFAGSQFNGGDGFDWLSIGGEVDFRGTVSSIEGIDLQSGFAATANNPGQDDATLIIGSSILGAMPSNLAIRGVGDIDIDIAAGSNFDGSGYTFDSGAVVDIEIFGSAQGESIVGTSGDDEINAGGGNDTINGGAGRDDIYGDAGDDLILVTTHAPAAGEVFDGGEGIDTLRVGTGAGAIATIAGGQVATVQLTGVTLNSIERIAFASTAETGITAVINPGQVGSGLSATAELIGGAGNDMLRVLAGSAGNYTLSSFVRGGGWTSSNDVFAPGDTVMLLATGSGNYTLNASAGHAGVEILIGGAGNDTLNGNDGAEILNGGGGVNILNGGGGNDRLGAINNTPFGGSMTQFTFAGSQFNGGEGFDWLSIGGYVNFQGTLSSIEGIDLQAGFAPGGPGTVGQGPAALDISTAVLDSLPANVMLRGVGDIDISIEAGDDFDGSGVIFDANANIDIEIFGSDQGDRIVGTSADDEINGEGGNDTITGGAGNDEIDGGAGIDVAVYAGASSSYTISAGSGGTVLIDGDVLANIEVFSFADGNFSWDGSRLVSIDTGSLTGTTGNETINGTAQADVIRPGGGTDIVNANGGDDRIILDAVTTGGTINGGPGVDTLELRTIAGSPGALDGPLTRYGGFGLVGVERIDYGSDTGNAVSLGLGYHVVNANGTFTLGAPSLLIGNDGTDSLVLAAVGGMGTDSNIVLPTLSVADWLIPSRPYQHGDVIALVAGDGANYRLSASEANANSGLRQSLLGNGGNDTLNGSAGKDVLNGAGGVNQLNGNDGDDALVITNSIGSEFTGAGSIFNGGGGTDFLVIGGPVNFQGTVQSIEGIHLQSPFTSNVPNIASQGDAVLTISSATIGAMAANLILDGAGDIIVNVASGGSFNGSGYSFEAGSDVGFSLVGTSGNQSISGTSGDDFINGKGGTDTIGAGAGNDTLILDASITGGNYNGGNGIDTIILRSLDGAARGPNGPATVYAGAPVSGFERVEFQSTAGTSLTFGIGYHIVQGATTLVAPPTTIVGGAGSDTFVLSALGGMGTDSDILMPTFSATNWTAGSRAYAPGDIVILSAADGASYRLSAADANSGIRQGLLGNAGNDTLNGSSGMDLLNGNGGANELHGNGGNDVLVVAGGNNGAGSLFDGGSGTDFLSVGGTVDFQGTIQSIEGIFLQPAFTSAAQGIPSQGMAALTISSQTIGAMAPNLTLDGSGSITVNVGSGQTFDGSAFGFESGANVRFTVFGAGGAESISGTGQADMIGGGAGNDTINGGDGADRIMGGEGDDVIDGGAGVDTVRFAGNRADYVAQAGSGGSVMVGGDQVSNVEIFSFDDGDFTWNGTQLVGVNQGTIADGYISGATVYIDVNGNGQRDAGEDFTTSDANGNYTLVSQQIGSLRATGGVNVDTGLANTLTFSAPTGSTVINPLTTLVETLVSGGASASAAEAQVKQAFGIDAGVELLKLDLVGAAATDSTGLGAQKAAVAVAELLNSVAGNGGNTGSALSTLTDLVTTGQPVDLTSQQVLTSVISSGLASAPAETVAAIVQQTQAVTQAVATAETLTNITSVQANSAPVGTNDAAAVNEDATVTGNVLTNDSDANTADILSVLSVGTQQINGSTVIQGAFGELTVNNDGSYSYVANGDRLDALATGQQRVDSFNYAVSDGKGGSAAATLAITITAVDDTVISTLDTSQTSFEGNGADENISGNSANNMIRGLGGADLIDGGSGDDSLSGGGGDDSLVGGSGHDWLYGGKMVDGDQEGGNDTLMGGDGNDHVYGNSLDGVGNPNDGADMIDLGDGIDYANGNGGNDTIIGGAGRDRIQGGQDNDSLSGGEGQDQINGNMGNDTISGGDGNDMLRGGRDNDLISGDAGNDILMGDLGNDTLMAGAGVDLLTGGAGADRFDFSGAGAGNFDLANFYTAITDFEQGIDRIRLGFTINAGEVLQGGSFGSVAAAQTAAAQALAGHAGTQDIVAAQVGADTYLFYNAAGSGNQITGIIQMFGVSATAIDQTDFVA